MQKISRYQHSIIRLALALVLSLTVAFAHAAPGDPNTTDFNSVYYNIDVNGTQRTLLFHLPTGYVQGSQLPVLFDFHGYGSNAAQQELISGMSTLADQYGFIVIYPQALPDFFGTPAWNTNGLQNADIDLDFVKEMLRLLGIYYGYEETRVYATGFSNGGGMVNLLAGEMADTFAAVGSVAGAYYDYQKYTPSRPVPVIAIHGTEDNIVPFDGEGVLGLLPPVYDWVNDWRIKNGCAEGADVLMDAGEIFAERWSNGCQAHIELYTVRGKGHAWPGSQTSADTSTDQINASQVMIEFFAKHPLR